MTRKTSRKGHLLMKFGDVDKPFDPMLEKSLHKFGDAGRLAAGVGNHERLAVAGEDALGALNDEDVGQTRRFVTTWRLGDGAGDQTHEPRLA